jgi:hypothetical protein
MAIPNLLIPPESPQPRSPPASSEQHYVTTRPKFIVKTPNICLIVSHLRIYRTRFQKHTTEFFVIMVQPYAHPNNIYADVHTFRERRMCDNKNAAAPALRNEAL